MTNNANRSVLRSSDGKFVTVQRFRRRLQLCIADIQVKDRDEYSLLIWTREEKNQIAFTCRHGTKSYIPKVEKKKLKLTCHSTSDSDSPSDSSWFEKVNKGGGEYYCLQSVVEPARYLCISGKRLSISSDTERCVFVTDEKI